VTHDHRLSLIVNFGHATQSWKIIFPRFCILGSAYEKKSSIIGIAFIGAWSPSVFFGHETQKPLQNIHFPTLRTGNPVETLLQLFKLTVASNNSVFLLPEDR